MYRPAIFSLHAIASVGTGNTNHYTKKIPATVVLDSHFITNTKRLVAAALHYNHYHQICFGSSFCMEDPGEKWRKATRPLAKCHANAAWRKAKLCFTKWRSQIRTLTLWQWGPWCSSSWLLHVHWIGSYKVMKPHARSHCLNRISQTGCKTADCCRIEEPVDTRIHQTKPVFQPSNHGFRCERFQPHHHRVATVTIHQK